MSINPTATKPLHPALIRHAEERASGCSEPHRGHHHPLRRLHGVRLRAHRLVCRLWIVVGVETYPFGLLTMIVSLEAIFLSTFVMISQNRADEKRQALADHQWQLIQLEKRQGDELLELVQLEKSQNEDILDLSRKILSLTTEVHELTGKVHSLVNAPQA